jgi:phosphohistidine phosphatase
MSERSEGATPRTLLVLRHAKSDWPDGVPDHERPLARRGRREAPLVGRWLREHGPAPDLVVCSTAVRARQTWELVAAELPPPPEVRLDKRMYEASAAELLSVVVETPDRVSTLLVVGHNPGLEELAHLLTAGQGDQEALERMSVKFPTAALAVLAFDGPWAGLRPSGARLVGFVVGRG